ILSGQGRTCMSRVALFLVALTLVLTGCGKDHNVTNGTNTREDEKNEQKASTVAMPALPDTLLLAFTPIELAELEQGEPASDWKYLNSIPFGTLDNAEIMLELYEQSTSDAVMQRDYHGILAFREQRFLIKNVSHSLKDKADLGCPEVCVMQRHFSNESPYELLGTVELFANGPGLLKFIVYDTVDQTLLSFDQWGSPGFYDLEVDGQDELVIEF